MRVDYATSDGTAVAGSDYTAASGTLTFAAGETEKTVTVAVLDDSHDEGYETLTLTLSNATGAHIADASATGAINNNDPMPQAWLARFGRTVAEQVLEAVDTRLQASRRTGFEGFLAGQRIGVGAGSGPGDPVRPQWRELTARDFVSGSSFALTRGTEKAGGLAASFWGRGAVSRFDGREGALSLGGEVAAGMLGIDIARGAWTGGIIVSHSRGKGDYRSDAGRGAISSTLTGLYPWARSEVNERLSVWGMAGYGAGEITLTPENRNDIPTEAGIGMGVAAVGTRGVLRERGADGEPEISLTSDGLFVWANSAAAAADLAASEVNVTRLRLGLQGSWLLQLEAGATLTPSLEAGIRHDGGDAETGFGADIGAGFIWAHPGRGFRAEFRVRGLLTHEEEGFRDLGVSGALAWDPTPGSALGWSMSLRQAMGGAAAGGMDALLRPDNVNRLAAGADGGELDNRRLEAKIGYGLPVAGGRYIGTPEVGIGVSETDREYRLGWRLGRARKGPVDFTFDIEGALRESVDDEEEPAHRIGLRLSLRW